MKMQDKYLKLISKLNRLTKEGKLSWLKVGPPNALKKGLEVIWVDFYTAYYAAKKLGIGEIRYQAYSAYDDEFHWAQDVKLALIDDDDDLRYEFPEIEGLWDLLETIRYSLADVEATVDHLIDAPDLDNGFKP